jgi:DnaK suppressor protein
MTGRQRDILKARLEQLEQALVASGPKRIEPARTDAATAGVADEDAQALTEMLQILASSQNKKQAENLGKIRAALRRLAAEPEAFGTCEDCDEPIAVKRLMLMPYVTTCTTCQAERDPRRGVGRKSLTDVD